MAYMLAEFYNFETLKERSRKGNLFYLIYDEEEAKGFAEIELNAAIQTTKLHKIYVLPTAQGKQLGLHLLNYIKEIAEKAAQARIILNVNRYNKAKTFYEKQGFEVFEEEDIDIGRGYFMNDYVMQFVF
ncbi:GNAT family N-acetyltransferase [Taibaiella sp. KBW10]|nr:GNAT family N-acetyltransferase [Taibaiella sp. KBW10]